MINFGLVATATKGPTMPILTTSSKEAHRNRKSINTNFFRLSPITYRNLVENDAIGESPILENLADSRSKESCSAIVLVPRKTITKS